LSNHVNSNINKNKENNLNSFVNSDINKNAKNNLIFNKKNSDEKISMIHWNSNSINNKIDEFNDFCFKYKPHIISLNETKLNDFRADYILQINNYNTIYKSRNSMRNGAGGVALLIREDIK
jgi:hypothetical protein